MGWRKEKEKKDSMDHGRYSITNLGHRLGGHDRIPMLGLLHQAPGVLIMDHNEDIAPVIRNASPILVLIPLFIARRMN